MPTESTLSLTDEIAPADPAALADAIRDAADSRTPVYPLGGRTALDFGLLASVSGLGVSTGGLNQIVEYDPRDMTITAQSGVTLARLNETLAAERQELPIDVPRAEEATLGGIIATNWNGLRRFGAGAIRDFLIGVSAVDGRGVAFKSGGRVMKNVAGYDFCKLLTGSLGTLAVMTQVTFKVRPKPERSAVMICRLRDWDAAARILDATNRSIARPAALELLAGGARANASLGDDNAANLQAAACLVAVLEGDAAEVAAMRTALADAWSGAGAMGTQTLAGATSDALVHDIVEFPDSGMTDSENDSPLTVKIAVRPSLVVAMCREILDADAKAEVVAHAGSGLILARFGDLAGVDANHMIVATLRPLALQSDGSLIVARTSLDGMTHQTLWGGRSKADDWAEKVKEQFDPLGALSPGRLP